MNILHELIYSPKEIDCAIRMMGLSKEQHIKAIQLYKQNKPTPHLKPALEEAKRKLRFYEQWGTVLK